MSLKKIAYIGKIQLSDVDLSYLHEAQQLEDITYIMEITPRFMNGPAFNVKQMYPKTGIFKAVDAYPQFKQYAQFIDLNKFYIVNTCGSMWCIKAFYTNLLLLIFLIKNKFDVIHLTWPLNVYEFIVYFLKNRMLLTVHDPFPHTGLDTFIVRLRRKVAFWLIPKFIILNRNQRQQFLDYYSLNEACVLNSMLSCYTYLRTVSPKSSSIPLEGKKYILFFGKISQYKGLDYLLPAMCKVHSHCPDLHLVVAGGGTFHFDIEKYKNLDYIHIENRFIEQEELVALIKNSYFVVCPYTDATQSGVVMSAFAFNKPSVVTNVGGLGEMVIDGKFGRVIKEKDVEALVEVIIQLADDEALINRYSNNIAEAYKSGELSWRKIAEMLSQEYKKVAE